MNNKRSGQKLWKRAKKIIPGGNMLLSKRAELFLPDNWPTYYKKAKGCEVWDIDGNKFIDVSIMGIGTNTLGYGHPEVDAAVSKAINSGNMSTLNSPEEVYLADELIDMHPWADMARFARSGGEANAIAIRIARAASGKDKVAICGYHGWHDWYLSANLGDDSKLDGHVLPGLDPKGVPRNLKDTVIPFSYNNLEELKQLLLNHDIGVIKMEVQRDEFPKNNFLQNVRDLATKNNIVLIFDECTSGFRESYGGIHKIHDVEPDMAIFGKALGNGYAITSVIGRREVMENAQSTFISSTFWTEKIGSVAALETLNVMKRDETWLQNTQTGKRIQQLWIELGEKYGLPISVVGIPAISSFTFQSKNNLLYKTIITQEFLKRGYLAGTILYASNAHDIKKFDEYAEIINDVYKLIADSENGQNVNNLLVGPICHAGFKRLN